MAVAELMWRFGPARKRIKILTELPCAPRDSITLLPPPPRTRFRQVVYLVYLQTQGRVSPLSLALLGSRFAVCLLFAPARRVFKGFLGWASFYTILRYYVYSPF
jgi:hypothetical protein